MQRVSYTLTLKFDWFWNSLEGVKWMNLVSAHLNLFLIITTFGSSKVFNILPFLIAFFMEAQSCAWSWIRKNVSDKVTSELVTQGNCKTFKYFFTTFQKTVPNSWRPGIAPAQIIVIWQGGHAENARFWLTVCLWSRETCFVIFFKDLLIPSFNSSFQIT